MSRYTVEIKEQAQEDLKVLSKSEPKAYQKALTPLQNFMTILRRVQANQNNLREVEAHCGTVASPRSTA